MNSIGDVTQLLLAEVLKIEGKNPTDILVNCGG
jgi:hypothetical protein